MKMEQTECSETSAYKIQTPGNYPEESVQHRALIPILFNKECMWEQKIGGLKELD